MDKTVPITSDSVTIADTASLEAYKHAICAVNASAKNKSTKVKKISDVVVNGSATDVVVNDSATIADTASLEAYKHAIDAVNASAYQPKLKRNQLLLLMVVLRLPT